MPTGEEVYTSMCIHMQALLLHCKEINVLFGGCGDCGSPWLTCKVCDKQVDFADTAFSVVP